MKVRVEIEGEREKSRYLELKFLPRVGELLEVDICGTCEVAQVLHTPQSEEQDAVLILRKT
jgi:hypothetical protein